MPTQRNRNTRRLQADDALFRWKVVAGVASIVFLAALFVTSLLRTPNPVYSVVVAVVTVVLAVAVAVGVRRRRNRR